MKEKQKQSLSPQLGISSKGFSLIEGLIAIGILVIAFLAILGTLSLGLRILQIDEQKSQVLLQDQASLEEILSLPYEEIDAPEIQPGLKEITINGLTTYKVQK